MRRPPLLLGVLVAGATVGALSTPLAASAASPSTSSKPERYLVVASSDADYAGLRAQAGRDGARVHDLHGTRTLAVDATPAVAQQLAASPLTASVVKDHVETLIDPEWTRATTPQLSRDHATHVGHPRSAPQDPASGLDGLLWNQARIRSPQANAVTYGSSAVTVAVADTGLDYTHSELAKKVSGNVDFTGSENPPLCKTDSGASDADLAAKYGGPADTDWNGHGSWIGGNIAASLDGVGINGVAPKVNLVGLKISQWCGSAYDSEILAAFEYAAQQHYDIVSISFGGYLDRSDPDQDAVYRQYVQTVAAARKAGTLIVAAAGNEHLRIGPGGQVLSHGPLTTPGTEPAKFVDYYGLYETPGGIPGVVDVSSTGNVVVPASASCPPQKGTSTTCKAATDAHQAPGAGRRDQLAYYSNYGPRIDVAGPGGARKFNLPAWDGGGTPGFPVTTDDTTAYQDFSITSNWAMQIPCYTLDAPTFYANECYSTIQGTSMATPHASAVAALIASAKPWLRHHPAALTEALKDSARDDVVNFTQPLSATDTTASDLTGVACPTGYCHLGGRPISSREAYGAGIVDALAGVRH